MDGHAQQRWSHSSEWSFQVTEDIHVLNLLNTGCFCYLKSSNGSGYSWTSIGHDDPLMFSNMLIIRPSWPQVAPVHGPGAGMPKKGVGFHRLLLRTPKEPSTLLYLRAGLTCHFLPGRCLECTEAWKEREDSDSAHWVPRPKFVAWDEGDLSHNSLLVHTRTTNYELNKL